jgi:predicted GNAT family N-acyltransferase
MSAVKSELIVIETVNENKNYAENILSFARYKNPNTFLFFKHEYTRRKKQIDEHLTSYSNSSARIIAGRKCKIKEITKLECRNFCKEYHIQGSNNLAIVAFGIFYENELLGVLSLGRHHRKNEDVLLDRMCFKYGVRVQGGASKLFARAIVWAQIRGIEKIISFSDNRYSLGNVYEKLGFKLEKELVPDYFYLDKINPLKYYSKQSQKKQNVDCPEDITEKQWAEKRGLVQIFDAGKKKWTYKLRKVVLRSFASRRRGYYNTIKGRPQTIFWQSSYELRAAIILDQREDVEFYTTQVKFKGQSKTRYIDFIVHLKDGTIFVLEVKPKNQIEKCKEQIKDNMNYAKNNGFGFAIWSLEELGFKSDYEQVMWADEFISAMQKIDYVEERRKRNLASVSKIYREKISNDLVEVYCDYCKEIHTPLRLTYERNINRNNGSYICESHGGFLSGSRPKDHLRVVNPYASEGKKQCRTCNSIKLIQGNFTWKSKPSEKKPTGTLSADCNACRTIIEKQKYHAKKNKHKEISEQNK